MIEAGGPSTGGLQDAFQSRVCVPTGGSHGRTTRGPVQRVESGKAELKRRAAPDRE
jgi:hypothetical protein